MKQEIISVTTAGSAGSATGSAVSGAIRGFIEAIYLDFHASAPNTTDTIVSYTDRGGNILSVTNTATDALHLPRKQCVDNATPAAAISGVYDHFPVCGALTISVAQSDALTGCVTAYIYYSEA